MAGIAAGESHVVLPDMVEETAAGNEQCIPKKWFCGFPGAGVPGMGPHRDALDGRKAPGRLASYLR
jgi:hypothetical protein